MVKLNSDQQLIREIVDTCQLPQERLARIMGVSFASIHAWLNGMRSPRPETLALIAEGLEEYASSVKRMAERAAAQARI